MSTDPTARLMLAGVTLVVAAVFMVLGNALIETGALTKAAATGLRTSLSLLVLLGMTIGINAANHHNIAVWNGLSLRRRKLFGGVLAIAQAAVYTGAATLIPLSGGVIRLIGLIGLCYVLGIFPLLRASQLGTQLEQWGRQVAVD